MTAALRILAMVALGWTVALWLSGCAPAVSGGSPWRGMPTDQPPVETNMGRTLWTVSPSRNAAITCGAVGCGAWRY